jgi:hypothetical protein
MEAKMNKSDLARKMLEWEMVLSQLVEIENEISKAVLELGETVVTGNVRARYSKGRDKFDWEETVNHSDATPAEIEEYTTHFPEEIIPAHDETDWAKLGKALKLEPIIIETGTPSVKVLLES